MFSNVAYKSQFRRGMYIPGFPLALSIVMTASASWPATLHTQRQTPRDRPTHRPPLLPNIQNRKEAAAGQNNCRLARRSKLTIEKKTGRPPKVPSPRNHYEEVPTPPPGNPKRQTTRLEKFCAPPLSRKGKQRLPTETDENNPPSKQRPQRRVSIDFL